MRNADDVVTLDLLPTCDLVGESGGIITKTKTRLDKMRERRGLRGLTVNLPAEMVDQFHAKRKAQGKSANEAIEHLLKTQFLRKR